MYIKRIKLLKEKIADFEQYPFHLPLINKLDKLFINENVTFFVGENGSGKSTLLEAIADQCGFNPASGGKNNRFHVDQAESALGDHIRLSWSRKGIPGFFLRAESFYQFASHLDEIAKEDSDIYQTYGGQSLHQRSHGEAFLQVFLNRFHANGIFLLDEPEASLSPARQLALLKVIHDLSPTSQFIIATHSPILLGYPDAKIWSFDGGELAPIAYEETEHFAITKSFLDNRTKILKRLFEPES